MRSSHRLAVVSIAGALALAACTGDPEPSPPGSDGSTAASPTTSAPAPTTSSPAPTGSDSPTATAPPGYSLDGRTSPTFPNLGGDVGGVGRVRVGHHEGYDRVVWEFAGSGRPTYQVHYVDTPLADGSGDPVPVRGDAFVEVLITTVGVPAEGTARPPDAPASALAGTVVAETFAIYGGFEGYGQTFIGIRGEQRPLRVTTLTNPTRLVVDIYTG
jgi:hypothetical protein